MNSKQNLNDFERMTGRSGASTHAQGPKTAREGALLNNSSKPRIAAAAALVACMVAAFATLGGVGQAQNAISAAQSQYGKKVTICHKGKTIKVSKHAVRAHLRHHDTLGPCSTVKAKHKKHKKHHKHVASPSTSTPPR